MNIGPVTPFGLVEVTRKRVRKPLVAQWSEDCGACGGQGRLRRPDVVAMDVLRRIEESSRAAPGFAIEVRAAPEVVHWLEAQDALAALLQSRIGRVSFAADAAFPRERFEVGTRARAQ